MDYSAILQELQGATLFDLYRLKVGIEGMLDQPERLAQVKRHLHPGMVISYFNGRKNRQSVAEVIDVQRTNVLVLDKTDGQRWNVPLHAVNLAGVDTDIHPHQGQNRLDKNQLRIGDSIGFHDRQNREQYGIIRQLNQKTVSIVTREGMRWRVSYGLLFKVMDGEGHQEADGGWIEGEIQEG
ncbi:MAG: hypothetical protein G8237_02870 [Magnetococcales bacterium]|nr:hypothetical protein [Magnetococcales bacterium]